MFARTAAMMKGVFAAMALALLAGTANAVPPLVQVTGCEPVIIGGHPAQKLTLMLAGQSQFFDTVGIWPRAVAGTDTCAIVDFTAPPGWKAFYAGVGGMVLFTGEPVELGQSLDGFEIVVNDVNCCYFVNMSNFLLFDSPGHGIACFRDCLATPARASSWGSLKAAYR